jgi:hypothetical protein
MSDFEKMVLDLKFCILLESAGVIPKSPLAGELLGRFHSCQPGFGTSSTKQVLEAA